MTKPPHPIPLSLYIHIPWCVRKCPYCDFNSHTAPDTVDETHYRDCLIADLEQELDTVQGRALQSIFFGGGTPSLLSSACIASILHAVQQRIPWQTEIEISLEANPGALSTEQLAGWRAAGINRLSVGVQSFHDQHLQRLGRIHNSDQARHTVDMAHRYFDNINIDLMHGLPNQTADEAVSDIEQAIACAPQHISWYQLTIEPNTAFYRSPPVLPEEAALADIESAGYTTLAAAGFKSYEVSAFSQPDHACRHNINYWLFGDYIGIGAGAHGKLTDANNGQVVRRWKTRQPQDYMNPSKPFLAGSRTVQDQTLVGEFMMNALRLHGGFTQTLFVQRTGQPWQALQPALTTAINDGLLIQHDQCVQTTALGRRFLNDLVARFFAP